MNDSEQKYCPSCGTKIEREASFCFACGEQFDEDVVIKPEKENVFTTSGLGSIQQFLNTRLLQKRLLAEYQ